jgi:hypothetical protein
MKVATSKDATVVRPKVWTRFHLEILVEGGGYLDNAPKRVTAPEGVAAIGLAKHWARLSPGTLYPIVMVRRPPTLIPPAQHRQHVSSVTPDRRPSAGRLPVLPLARLPLHPAASALYLPPHPLTLGWVSSAPPPTDLLSGSGQGARKWMMSPRQPKPSPVDIPLPPPTYRASQREGDAPQVERAPGRHQGRQPPPPALSTPPPLPSRCLRSPPLHRPPASSPNPAKQSLELGRAASVAQAIPCHQTKPPPHLWSSSQRRGGGAQKGVAWPASQETTRHLLNSTAVP